MSRCPVDLQAETIDAAEAIPGWFDRTAMTTLARLAAGVLRPGGLVVEVGSWQGRSSTILAAVAQAAGARLVCLDTWRGCPDPDHPEAEKYARLYGDSDAFSVFVDRVLRRWPNVTAVIGDSRATHASLLDGSADLVFLDGDHSNPVFAQDLDHFWPKVRAGGILCGDDWSQEDVTWEVLRRWPTPERHGRLWAVRKEG